MYQRSWLQSVVASFVFQVMSGEPAQFLVDDPNQFVPSLLVARAPGGQYRGYILRLPTPCHGQ